MSHGAGSGPHPPSNPLPSTIIPIRAQRHLPRRLAVTKSGGYGGGKRRSLGTFSRSPLTGRRRVSAGLARVGTPGARLGAGRRLGTGSSFHRRFQRARWAAGAGGALQSFDFIPPRQGILHRWVSLLREDAQGGEAGGARSLGEVLYPPPAGHFGALHPKIWPWDPS